MPAPRCGTAKGVYVCNEAGLIRERYELYRLKNRFGSAFHLGTLSSACGGVALFLRPAPFASALHPCATMNTTTSNTTIAAYPTDFALAWGLTTAASLSTLAGSSIVLFCCGGKNTRLRINPTMISASLGLAAGCMLFVAVAELFGKSEEWFVKGGHKEQIAKLLTTLSFFAGALFILLVNFLVDRISPDHHSWGGEGGGGASANEHGSNVDGDGGHCDFAGGAWHIHEEFLRERQPKNGGEGATGTDRVDDAAVSPTTKTGTKIGTSPIGGGSGDALSVVVPTSTEQEEVTFEAEVAQATTTPAVAPGEVLREEQVVVVEVVDEAAERLARLERMRSRALRRVVANTQKWTDNREQEKQAWENEQRRQQRRRQQQQQLPGADQAASAGTEQGRGGEKTGSSVDLSVVSVVSVGGTDNTDADSARAGGAAARSRNPGVGPPAGKSSGKETATATEREIATKGSTASKATKEESRQMYRMGVQVFFAVALHNLPEGLAAFLATLADGRSGLAIAFGVILHNIPEGICGKETRLYDASGIPLVLICMMPLVYHWC